MSDPHAPASAAGTPVAGAAPAAAGKGGGLLVPMLVAAAVSVGGGIGSSLVFAKKMSSDFQATLTAALAENGAANSDKPNGPDGHADKAPAHGAKKEEHGAKKEEHGAKKEEHGAKKEEHGAKKEEGKKEEGKEGKDAPPDTQKGAREAGLFQLGAEPIVANPLGTDGARFVVARVTIESIGKEDISEAVNANMDRLKDAVTGYLSDTSMETLQSRGFKSQLSAQLALSFNRILGPGTVKSVIIPQLVVQ